MKDRGILTERDREIIRDEPNHDRRPEIKSRVRTRVDRVQQDLQIIEEHDPELAEQLHKTLFDASIENEILDVARNIERKVDELQNEA